MPCFGVLLPERPISPIVDAIQIYFSDMQHAILLESYLARADLFELILIFVELILLLAYLHD